MTSPSPAQRRSSLRAPLPPLFAALLALIVFVIAGGHAHEAPPPPPGVPPPAPRRVPSVAGADVAGAAPAHEGIVPTRPVPPVLQVVLFGPYSNLAKKYLWQSLLEIWDQISPATLHVVAASRDPDEVGLGKVRAIVESATNCGAGVPSSSPHCARLRSAFLQNVTYVSVRDEAGYARLGSVLRASEEGDFYIGRVFYMAVAADIVPDILQKVSSGGWVVVVVVWLVVVSRGCPPRPQ
jgi:hypothetical protein